MTSKSLCILWWRGPRSQFGNLGTKSDHFRSLRVLLRLLLFLRAFAMAFRRQVHQEGGVARSVTWLIQASAAPIALSLIGLTTMASFFMGISSGCAAPAVVTARRNRLR